MTLRQQATQLYWQLRMARVPGAGQAPVYHLVTSMHVQPHMAGIRFVCRAGQCGCSCTRYRRVFAFVRCPCCSDGSLCPMTALPVLAGQGTQPSRRVVRAFPVSGAEGKPGCCRLRETGGVAMPVLRLEMLVAQGRRKRCCRRHVTCPQLTPVDPAWRMSLYGYRPKAGNAE